MVVPPVGEHHAHGRIRDVCLEQVHASRRPSRELWSLVLLGLGLGLGGGGVAAAQPAPPANAGKGDAKELMQLGVKLLKSQDYLGALAVFKDAYQRFPSAKILLNIGTTLKLLGRNAEAANAYQRYLDSQDADPARKPDVEKEVASLDKSLGQLAIDAPAEAEIQVNTEDWMPASLGARFRLAPGPYTVRARRKGYQPFEVTGVLAVGQAMPVPIVMVVDPVPVAEKVFITVPADGGLAQPRSRFGVIAIGHFDVSGGGAAFVGGVFDVTRRLQARAAGIIGPNFGGFAGASFAFLVGTLRPFVAAGMPVFFNDGGRIGVRGAAGLEIVANRHFAFIVEVGVEHMFNPQMEVEFGGTLRTIDPTSFIPAIGASARL